MSSPGMAFPPYCPRTAPPGSPTLDTCGRIVAGMSVRRQGDCIFVGCRDRQELEQVVVIPARGNWFGMDTTRTVTVESDQVEGDAPEHGQILGCKPDPHPVLILAEGDVQHPVLRVLDTPVPAHGGRERVDLAVQVAAVAAGLPTAAARRRPFAHNRPDTVQIRPGCPVRIESVQHVLDGRRPVAARLQRSVASNISDEEFVRHSAPVLVDCLGEYRLDGCVGSGLVALERQDIFGAADANGGGRCGLSVQGIQRNDRADDVQERQQDWDGRDCIGMVSNRELIEDELVVAGPRTDQIDRRAIRAPFMRAPCHLPIDGDDPSSRTRQDGLGPGEKAALEGEWIEAGEHPTEGVV